MYYLQAEIWVLWAKRDGEPGKGILVGQVENNRGRMTFENSLEDSRKENEAP